MYHQTPKLGCAIERVVGNFHSLTVDLHVPRGSVPDMGGALAYTAQVMPNATTVNVFQAPGDRLVLVYRWDAEERKWVAFVPEKV